MNFFLSIGDFSIRFISLPFRILYEECTGAPEELDGICADDELDEEDDTLDEDGANADNADDEDVAAGIEGNVSAMMGAEAMACAWI